MSLGRTSITIRNEIWDAAAKKVKNTPDDRSFSAYVERLIRKDLAEAGLLPPPGGQPVLKAHKRKREKG